jgi:hypothetical protein
MPGHVVLKNDRAMCTVIGMKVRNPIKVVVGTKVIPVPTQLTAAKHNHLLVNQYHDPSKYRNMTWLLGEILPHYFAVKKHYYRKFLQEQFILLAGLRKAHENKKWISSALPIQIMMRMAADPNYDPTLSDFKDEVKRLADLDGSDREAGPDHGHYAAMYQMICSNEDSETKWQQVFENKHDYSKNYLYYCRYLEVPEVFVPINEKIFKAIINKPKPTLNSLGVRNKSGLEKKVEAAASHVIMESILKAYVEFGPNPVFPLEMLQNPHL